MKNHPALCFLLTFVYFTSLYAERPLPPGLARTAVEVRIYTLPIKGILTQESTYQPLPAQLTCSYGGRKQKIRLRRNGYTDSFYIQRGTVTDLFVSSEKGRQKQPYLQIKTSADWQKALIVLDPANPDDEGRPKTQIFQTDPEKLVPFTQTFVNLLPNPLELTIGEEKHIIPGSESLTLLHEEKRTRIFLKEIAGENSRSFTSAVYSMKDRGVLQIIQPRGSSSRRLEMLTLQTSPDTDED